MKSIRYCLNKQLADLCKHAVELEELALIVTKLLPANLAPYCKFSSFNKNCLVIIATDASWASQIRYALPELRDKLRQSGIYQLSSIKVTVDNQKEEYKKTKKVVHYQLTEETKKSIINESEHCSYEPLQKALLNLAQKSKPVEI